MEPKTVIGLYKLNHLNDDPIRISGFRHQFKGNDDAAKIVTNVMFTEDFLLDNIKNMRNISFDHKKVKKPKPFHEN